MKVIGNDITLRQIAERCARDRTVCRFKRIGRDAMIVRFFEER